MQPTIKAVRGAFSTPQNSRHSLVTGGINTQVQFPAGSLTDEELKYCRLVMTTDFFQLVRTAVYMSEGLTFKEATIKYLTAKKLAQ